jgi:hypothetical protein
MDEVSVEAKVAGEGVAPPLVVAVPRLEVQRAIDEEQEADLMLDVVRTNGKREERRVLVGLDGETLRQLIADQQGEQILVAVDPESLASSFDDVEAHGLREVGATLAIAVAAVGAGAGAAGAEGLQPALSTSHAVQATTVQSTEAGMPRAMPSDYGQMRVGEQQMPRAMPSDYAAQKGDESVTLRRDPGAMPTGAAISEPTERGIENVRASQPPPAEAPDATSGIESVRVGGTAVPDPSSGIEAVRAERAPAGGGDGGITIAAPGTGAAVAIAGGAMLTIAAAAFALRRKREPRLA